MQHHEAEYGYVSTKIKTNCHNSNIHQLCIQMPSRTINMVKKSIKKKYKNTSHTNKHHLTHRQTVVSDRRDTNTVNVLTSAGHREWLSGQGRPRDWWWFSVPLLKEQTPVEISTGVGQMLKKADKIQYNCCYIHRSHLSAASVQEKGKEK